MTDKCAGKLAPRFYGSYKVLDRVGDVAYRLTLPPRAHIHCVFHVVFLKKYNGDPLAEKVPLPPIHNGCVFPMPVKVKKRGMPQPWLLGIAGPVGGVFCSRCSMGEDRRVQGGSPEAPARGRAIFRGGWKCCGHLCGVSTAGARRRHLPRLGL
jgi:hypothetical protein